MKLCWLVNNGGQVVSWAWGTANVSDKTFLPLVEALDGQTIVLADVGFNDKDGIPDNLKLCPRGTWNEPNVISLRYTWMGAKRLGVLR